MSSRTFARSAGSGIGFGNPACTSRSKVTTFHMPETMMIGNAAKRSHSGSPQRIWLHEGVVHEVAPLGVVLRNHAGVEVFRKEVPHHLVVLGVPGLGDQPGQKDVVLGPGHSLLLLERQQGSREVLEGHHVGLGLGGAQGLVPWVAPTRLPATSAKLLIPLPFFTRSWAPVKKKLIEKSTSRPGPGCRWWSRTRRPGCGSLRGPSGSPG
jgi:hypothetical protein